MTPTLVIAAPATGSGKTVLTAALARALARRGLTVAAFKVGPDYIDAGWLAAATGGRAGNLDPWAMRPATQDVLLAALADGADLVLGEGVMGLFDGARDGSGSTADLCARLRLPVLLAVDARRQGASLAALAHGFASFRDDVEVAGVLLNRVGGPAHRALLEAALVDRPPLGQVPDCPPLAVPSRHLGLRQAREIRDMDIWLNAAAAVVADYVDLDRLCALARPPTLAAEAAPGLPVPPPGQRIAVAEDDAFAFTYAHLLAGWHAAGATLSRFSPLANQAPDADADAVYLPGGYPELWAGQLAAADRFMTSLAKAAGRGAAIYGECGGYMVLGQSLIDAEGHRHRMAGLLGLDASFAEPQRRLGYRQVRLLADGPLGDPGQSFRGHEFHYAAANLPRGTVPLLAAADALGRDLGAVGESRGNVAGSFIHLVDSAP